MAASVGIPRLGKATINRGRKDLIAALIFLLTAAVDQWRECTRSKRRLKVFTFLLPPRRYQTLLVYNSNVNRQVAQRIFSQSFRIETLPNRVIDMGTAIQRTTTRAVFLVTAGA